MTSLPKTMATLGPPQNQTNYIPILKVLIRATENTLSIEFEPFCQKLSAFMSNFGLFTMSTQ